jgi:hypothetical protein
MTLIANHPERNIIRVQLKQNVILKVLRDSEMAALEPYLTVVNHQKGDLLLNQGVVEMEQYFILDGILKRQVTNHEAKEMILRFSAERDIETSYAAWCLPTASCASPRRAWPGCRWPNGSNSCRATAW